MLFRRVVGKSMEPTIRAGQLVVAVKLRRPVRIGDTVVILLDDREVIKRVALRNDGLVYVLGDNSAASTDSRTLGWLPKSTIRGRVIWPRNKPAQESYKG